MNGGIDMEKRKLGKSGLEIAPLVLGGNVFGWTADEPRSFAILDAFVGAGFNMIDTADVYSVWAPGNKGGESETVIGNWLKKRGARDKVLVATKVGYELSPTHKGLKKSYILSEVETSLKRLKTDYIDLYWSHIDDPTTAVDETLSAHDQLVKQGKVRAIGASNFGAPRLKESLDTSRKQGYPRYQGLQPLYNLSDREEFEAELEPLCEKEGLGVLTYFSLASGFLTGKYRSEKDLEGKARSGEVKKHMTPRGQKILAALDDVARKHNARPAQIALAWLLARPSVTAPISSATSVDQLKELIAATEIKLDRESIAALDKASAWR
jgi:aryl-alcohol dehydrogenase-like predicted oxidoreductase